MRVLRLHRRDRALPVLVLGISNSSIGSSSSSSSSITSSSSSSSSGSGGGVSPVWKALRLVECNV